MKNYYDILGVPKSASKEKVKQAYRKLAHQYHPDRGGDEKKFKEINEAYQVLGDEKKRAQYDQFGSAFSSQGFGGDHRGFGGFDFSSFGGNARGFDFNDIFSEFFSGGARPTTKTKQSGADIQVDISITLEEAYQGVIKTIQIKKYNICSRCGGKKNEPGSNLKACGQCGGTGEIRRDQRILFGTFTQVSECPSCAGEGKIPEKKCSQCRGLGRVQQIEEIKINIPAGIHSGEAIKISGKGEAGDGGYGNLYAYIRIKHHRDFEREGDDILSALSISMSQAVLGDSLVIKTLAGSENIRIPAGIESWEMIKLEGRGMPRLRGAGRGDHYIKIVVKTPRKLSKRAKEIFEELKREGI